MIVYSCCSNSFRIIFIKKSLHYNRERNIKELFFDEA